MKRSRTKLQIRFFPFSLEAFAEFVQKHRFDGVRSKPDEEYDREMLRLLVDEVTELVNRQETEEAAETVQQAALAGFMFAQTLMHQQYGHDLEGIPTLRKMAKGQRRAEEERQQRVDEKAAIVQDRVALLVGHGKSKTEAKEKAARDIGKSVRQVERYLKRKRHG